MSELNSELSLISSESPAGVNLEYDPLYLALEDESSAHDGGAIEDDSSSAPLSGDFKALQKHCATLWEQTRDFKVAVFYTIALTVNQGLSGFNHGLSLLNFLSQELWTEAYPQLDPDDDLDPTERLNILSTLSPQNTVNDPINFLAHLGQLKLGTGIPYTVRDLLQAKGTIDNKDDIDLALLTAQVQAAGPDVLNTMNTEVQTALSQLEQLEQSINEHLQDTGYIHFERLHKILSVWLHFCQEISAAMGIAAGAGADNSTEGVALEQGASAPTPVPTSASQVNATSANTGVSTPANRPFSVNDVVITNRKDALALIEKCSAYFKLKEPTSPVPFLLKRAIAMADMDFIQLLGEIDSSARERGKEQFGIKDDSSDSY
ncbi:MAG TPA: type VI secretion system ImpA family N-terminal domain-containing protein [Candidatus Anaerobiospirillum pullistercoris]|uniref:Type VI secretion system ImpA family N-terminal domain-containing protein n=1 Tax=Candidatus Anaerobiospirillum pullistercoris TaxID=2838452 RepID=A0A9D1WBL8_9GAMM|nr:type VI secretion system ImpA family N-terminal domain-containing protein [Candidatus Anaerobiospirillum pullistercoris]